MNELLRGWLTPWLTFLVPLAALACVLLRASRARAPTSRSRGWTPHWWR